MAIQKFDFNALEVQATSGEALAHQAKAGTIAKEVNTYDILGTLQGMAKLSATMEKDKELADGILAKQHIRDFKNSEGYLQASEAGKVDMIKEWEKAIENESPAYKRAWLSNTDAEYYTRSQKAELERQQSVVNNSFTAWEQERDLYREQGLGELPIDKFIDNFSMSHGNIPKDAIRDMIIKGTYEKSYDILRAATNSQELNAIEQYLAEERVPLQHTKVLGSNSMGTREYVNAADREYQNIISLKKNQFKMEAEQRLAAKIGDTSSGFTSFLEPVSALYSDIKELGLSPLEERNKLQYLQDGYEKAQGSRTFNSKYGIGSVRPALPEGNDVLKKDRQKMVTNSVLNSFVLGNFDDMIRIVNNENGLQKEAGDSIINMLNNNTDANQAAKFFEDIQEISFRPNGSTALRQLMSDEAFAELMAVNYMRQVRPDMNTVQIRDYIHQASMATTDVPFDPSTNAEVYEYATKLGTQGSKYLAVMDTLRKINPQLAKDKYKDIAQHFTNQSKTSNGISQDNSMGINPINSETVFEEDVVMGKLIENMSTKAGVPITSIVTLPNNVIIGEDKWSGIVTVSGVGNLIQTENAAYEKRKIDENWLRTRKYKDGDLSVVIPEVLSNLTRNVVDGTGPFIVGAGEVLSTLTSNIVSKFKKHLINSMSDSEQKFFGVGKYSKDSTTTDMFDKEVKNALLVQLKNTKQEYPTQIPNIVNNTMSQTLRLGVDNALLINKKKNADIDKLINAVEGE